KRRRSGREAVRGTKTGDKGREDRRSPSVRGMASPSSSSVPPQPVGGPMSSPASSTATTEDATRDVIYKLLLAKLMEVQSSSLGGATGTATAADSNGLQPHQQVGGMGSASGLFPQFAAHQALTNGLSPPVTSASSLFQPPTATNAAAAAGYGGLPTTPTREGNRIGQKRASPYAESHTPPSAPPHPATAAAAAGVGVTPIVGSSATSLTECSPGGSLPNFLLVKITDLRTVEKLQNLLARNGFTETRLVLASGESPQSASAPSATGASLGASHAPLASTYEEDMMMDMDQDPTLNAHHHQMSLLQSGSDGERRDSMRFSKRLQHIPDVAATEEIADEEEEENVEVVDESSLSLAPLGLPSSSSSSLIPPSTLPLVPPPSFAQLSPPVNGNEPPTDIQVAEVRHRSVSRSDGVDNEDVYVKCRLCENRIMNTRLSNLTNHVRRHAKLKQFQCAHCSYEHNEIFKVRTHMSRAHGDTASAPLDRRSPEMERQWEALMHACFPRNPLLHPQNGGGAHKEYSLTSSASFSNPSSSNGDGSSSHLFTGRATFSPGSNSVASRAAQHAARGRYSPAHTASPPGTYTCSSCKESMPEDSLQSHIRDEHSSLLASMLFYICRECGFKSSQKDRVRMHAQNTHDVADIMPIPVENRPSLALQKLFPEKRVVTNEECEVHASHGGQPHDHHLRVESDEEEGEGGQASANNGQKHTCRMCQRTLSSSQAAVTHAKKHYPTRQFHCTLCLYQAVDEAKVRAHLLTKHMSIDLPINVVDPPMQRGWMDTMESCFPELANSTGAALIGTFADDIGEDCESDTKRRKLERAAAAAAAAATDAASNAAAGPAASAAVVPPPSTVNDSAISPSTTCHITRATEAEEEEEIDVV
ncbi:hypothetical protein PENTCL1PPCAC_24657, partial [Pristionchus entomophagus]